MAAQPHPPTPTLLHWLVPWVLRLYLLLQGRGRTEQILHVPPPSHNSHEAPRVSRALHRSELKSSSFLQPEPPCAPL